MTTEIDDGKAMGEVKERLAARFPDRSPAEIGAIVDEIHSELIAGAKVKDFVPVLVEKTAKKRLKAAAAG